MLPDSGHIQEFEVERLNRRNRQRGRPLVEPIYTRRDAERCLEQASPCDYDAWFEPGPGVRARYWNAAHILGSASIELEIADGPGRRYGCCSRGTSGRTRPRSIRCRAHLRVQTSCWSKAPMAIATAKI